MGSQWNMGCLKFVPPNHSMFNRVFPLFSPSILGFFTLCLEIPSLKLTAKAPENGWLEYFLVSFWDAYSFREGTHLFLTHFRDCWRKDRWCQYVRKAYWHTGSPKGQIYFRQNAPWMLAEDDRGSSSHSDQNVWWHFYVWVGHLLCVLDPCLPIKTLGQCWEKSKSKPQTSGENNHAHQAIPGMRIMISWWFISRNTTVDISLHLDAAFRWQLGSGTH